MMALFLLALHGGTLAWFLTLLMVTIKMAIWAVAVMTGIFRYSGLNNGIPNFLLL